MRGHAGHADLALRSLLGREVDGGKLILLGNHAHLDILLVLGSDVLLLLLQKFDLLL